MAEKKIEKAVWVGAFPPLWRTWILGRRPIP